jgi:hypothetical protein
MIRTLAGNKSQIIKDQAFCSLLNNKLPEPDALFTSIFDDFDQKIRAIDASITREALSNVHGDWYEWLLAISSWNYCCDNHDANLAILLPSINQFNVSSLYEPRLLDLIIDLKEKVSKVSSVQLITSNPDFVIINRKIVDGIIRDMNKVETITENELSRLELIHRQFTGKCGFEEIEGYISVKTSLRPDRRLQISHEGSLMKALYAHLQTREWITAPKGLKYFAIATEIKEPDRVALKTVATHSLTTVFSLPQAAVDGVFEVNSLQQAVETFSFVLG